MTDRLQKAIANPNTSLIGHPTGRLLLRRDAYQFDLDAVSKRRPNTSGDGAELLSRPARPQRRSSASSQTAWRENRHQYRFSPHFAPGKLRYGVTRPPSLAYQRGCTEHAASAKICESDEAKSR